MKGAQIPAGPDLSSLRIDERARTSGGLGKRLGLFAAGLGAVILVAGLVARLKGHKLLVEVAVAQRAGEEKVALLNASGYVTPRRRATVAAKITGRVTAIFAEEGMHVKDGQVLATLDDADARTRFESAKADRNATAAAIADLEVNLENAERELRRAQELQASGVQTVQALDLARTTVNSLRARIALAKEQVRAAARELLGVEAIEISAGHCPHLSRPAQLARLLAQIVCG